MIHYHLDSLILFDGFLKVMTQHFSRCTSIKLFAARTSASILSMKITNSMKEYDMRGD